MSKYKLNYEDMYVLILNIAAASWLLGGVLIHVLVAYVPSGWGRFGIACTVFVLWFILLRLVTVRWWNERVDGWYQ